MFLNITVNMHLSFILHLGTSADASGYIVFSDI